MRGMRLIAAAVVCAVICTANANAQRRRTPPRIAIVVEGDADLYRAEVRRLAGEVNTLLESRDEGWQFPSEPTHVGDFTRERAETMVGEVLADRDVDLVIGFGIQVGAAVGRVERLNKPVLLPFAAPRIQGLPRDGEHSGRHNLGYLTGLIDLERELRRFRDVMRRENATVLVDRHIFDAIENPEEFAQQFATGTMRIQVVPVDPPAQSILDAIPEDSHAVYIGVLVRLPDSEIQALIDGINARGIPSYAAGGRPWVDMGVFTSLVPEADFERRMRRMALYIQEAIDGEDPATFSTVFEPRAELAINMATARRIGVWPRFELMTEAILVGQDESQQRGRSLNLRAAVSEAVERNLDLEGSRRDVRMAGQQVSEARGGWLPTLDGNAAFNWIDPDVASSFGNAERQLSWGLSAQQVIYSPELLSGIRARRANLRSVEHGLRSTELDLVQAVAVGYLNVLRARTAEEVNRENLQRIRRNLSLAEVRVQIGSAGRQEVFRWEVEIAGGRAAVIAASAARNQAEINVNRLLNRDHLEEAFRPVEPTDPDTGIVLDDRIAQYVDDPWSFRVLREFAAREAILNSPEIRQLDAAIRAQSLVLDGRRQRLYVPDVVANAGFTHTFHRSGQGSEQTVVMGLPPDAFPAQDDFTWQVGLGLRFRFFDAARYPEIARTETQIGQLEIQRRSIAQQIEQRVRSEMHQAGASRAAVRLRRDAAHASAQNLDMVTDAYRRGAVSIITLIDAQNQALLTQLNAANAVYDFMIDYIGVERATGGFGFRMTSEQREGVIRRLNQLADQYRRDDRAQRQTSSAGESSQ